MNSGLSRRGVVAAIAAAFAAPPVQIALATSPDTIALARWSERQTHVERLRGLSAAYDAAKAKLPAWAQPGHRSIDQDGNPYGEVCNWPLDETVTPLALVGEWCARQHGMQRKTSISELGFSTGPENTARSSAPTCDALSGRSLAGFVSVTACATNWA